MGTYIRPLTQNRDVLARLAGICKEKRSETWQDRKFYRRLDKAISELANRSEPWETTDLQFEAHNLQKACSPDSYQLDHAVCFGFGKLKSLELARFLDKCGDETRDPVKVTFILDHLGYRLPRDVSSVELGGLYWT